MIYVRDSLPFHHWHNLSVTDLETTWITIEMPRLPRGVCNFTIGLVYHPPGSKDKPMLDHINACIDHIRLRHPETGIILCGDVNQLKDARIKNDLQLKQLVKKPTRGKSILDKIYTNCHQYFGEPVVLSPVGLSDHCVVLCQPALGGQTRCMGANERALYVYDGSEECSLGGCLQSRLMC